MILRENYKVIFVVVISVILVKVKRLIKFLNWVFIKLETHNWSTNL